MISFRSSIRRIALTFMMVMYALEPRDDRFILVGSGARSLFPLLLLLFSFVSLAVLSNKY